MRLAEADDAATTDIAAVIDQFNAAFLERAPEKLVDRIAADCVEVRQAALTSRDHC